MFTTCRLCLADDANFNIFTTSAAAHIRIMTCTALEVQSDDGLPQLICSNCRLRLEEFYYFRKRAHAVDRKLRRFKRLQSQGRSGELYDNETAGDEDELQMKGPTCTPTACIESAASWRMEAAQAIRTEIEAYKKELLRNCQLQVREEIEQQVRNEVEAMLLAEARKQCRINVLDDLFYEMENFFIRKRNEATYELVQQGSEGFGSDSEAVELESVSTFVGAELPGNSNVVVDTDGVVEIFEEEPAKVELLVSDQQVNVQTAESPKTNFALGASPKTASSATTFVQEQPKVVPMVEIHMHDNQLRHLQEEFTCKNFLTPASPQSQKTRTPQSGKQVSGYKRNLQNERSREHICRRHSGFARYSTKNVPGNSCVRCRLRAGHAKGHGGTSS